MLEFKQSDFLTLGVELELMVLNTRDYNLTRGAGDLLRAMEKIAHPGEVKPEITEGMFEISTSVHARYEPLAAELRLLRDLLTQQARKLNLGLAGGGAHAFQEWHAQRIYDTPRFRRVSELYGYLAQHFTVFGQHIHIGCRNGNEALYLMHAISRYMPHFIALSAASPFWQGADTMFDSARLNVVNAFPLSGSAPFVMDWPAFNAYFERMKGFGIVESMKDFYWDIRPKPEFGTIEIRVCDTPLTVGKAAALAAYAQALAKHLIEDRPQAPREDMYLVYGYNRFQACRFGLDAMMVDPATGKDVALAADLVATLDRVVPHAQLLESLSAINALRADVLERRNDARWLRAVHAEGGTLAATVRRQAQRWLE